MIRYLIPRGTAHSTSSYPSGWYLFAVVAIVVGLTLVARFVPFVIKGSVRKSKPLNYLSNALPAGVMLILVIYTLKDVSLIDPEQALPPAAGIAVTLLLHWWKRNVLLSLVAGTGVFWLVSSLLG